MVHNKLAFKLPHGITGPVELNRLIREAQTTDELIRQASLRKGGDDIRLPRLGGLMTELLQANNLNILHESDRKQLTGILSRLKAQAPVIHMSFSADPPPLFMRKLIQWLRQEIHPYLLVRIGLQPAIGAGCIVRTNNKYYDFSLRDHFAKNKHILIERLHATGLTEVKK